MPSGDCNPITDEEMEQVWKAFQAAEKEGLVHEWLQWYSGGLKQGLSPPHAALHACIEWDIL